MNIITREAEKINKNVTMYSLYNIKETKCSKSFPPNKLEYLLFLNARLNSGKTRLIFFPPHTADKIQVSEEFNTDASGQ